MGSYTPGAKAPIKYTVESFIGVRDAWLSFAADRLSKAASALEQYKQKLPESLKSKLPNISKKNEVPAPTTTAAPLES